LIASRRRISDNTLVDSLTVISMERMHFTGSSKNDTITGGSKNSILVGWRRQRRPARRIIEPGGAALDRRRTGC
jgi:hypothetical protein